MEQFLKVDYNLLMMNKVLTKDGTEVSLTMNTKILYALMYDRFLFFSTSGQEYFDTTNYLATRLNVTPKTVENGIKLLESVGLVEKRQIVYNNLPKNVYERVKPLGYLLTREVKNTNSVIIESDIDPHNCPF